MRSKLVQGRKSINCANSVLPAYILNPRERVPENLADTRFYVQVDTTPKAKIPSSTQQVARYSRVLSRTAVDRSQHSRTRNFDQDKGRAGHRSPRISEPAKALQLASVCLCSLFALTNAQLRSNRVLTYVTALNRGVLILTGGSGALPLRRLFI